MSGIFLFHDMLGPPTMITNSSDTNVDKVSINVKNNFSSTREVVHADVHVDQNVDIDLFSHKLRLPP